MTRDQSGRFSRADHRQRVPPHGTRARYVHRSEPCRCAACREANAAYIADLREQERQAARTWEEPPMFDVEPYTVELEP